MKTLKVEEVYLVGYRTFADTSRLPRALLRKFTMPDGMHSALGYVSPEQFESQLARQAA